MNNVHLADCPDVLTVPEAASILRLSRNGVYAAVQAGQLPVIRMGRRILVPRAALEQLLSVASKTSTTDEVAVKTGHMRPPTT